MLTFPGITTAQENAGIAGRVTDTATGLPLQSAVIDVVGTALNLQSDASGDFLIQPLQPGRYHLEISHLGYKRKVISGIVVMPEGLTQVEARLQPDPLHLPEMTVRATKIPRAGTYAGARVISRSDIRAIKPHDLPDLLEKQGLATVVSDGSPGGRRTVTIRGSASDQVLVLLDGHPLNESADGAADLSRISLAEILQVEVYPQAPTMLGSQAVGGVINIITLKPGFSDTRLQASAGQYGERQGSVTLGRTWGEKPAWPLLGIFEHRESSGEYRYRVVPDDGVNVFTRNVGQTLTRFGADYRRDMLSLKANLPGSVEATFRRSILHRHNPDYLPLPVQPHESTTADDRQEFTLEMKPEDVWYRPDLTVKLEGYHQETVTDYGPQYPLLNKSSELRGEVYCAQANWTGHFGWREISYGTGARYERLWANTLQNGYAGRLHEFGYLQVQGEPLKEVTLPFRTAIFSGVRADMYQGQQPFIHPNLGLEVGGGEAVVWSLRGQVAGAYHLPSFNALFWQEDLQSRGNPNLKPERSLNREASGKIGSRGLELSLAWFDRPVWDLIYWRLDFDNKWKPLNLHQAKIYGTEVTLNGRLGSGLTGIELNASHRWMKSVNRSSEPNTDGMQLPYRPINTTTLSVVKDLKYVSTDFAARWISHSYTNEANTQSLSPYTVWDAGLTKTVNVSSGKTSLTFRTEIRNLFNKSYRIIEKAPVPLREIWIIISLEQTAN